MRLLSYHSEPYHYYPIIDLKRQNRLKVGTKKPKLKVKMQCSQYQMMMSAKDFLKSHVLSWRRKVYSDWEDVMLHLPAGHSRSSGQLQQLSRGHFVCFTVQVICKIIRTARLAVSGIWAYTSRRNIHVEYSFTNQRSTLSTVDAVCLWLLIFIRVKHKLLRKQASYEAPSSLWTSSVSASCTCAIFMAYGTVSQCWIRSGFYCFRLFTNWTIF